MLLNVSSAAAGVGAVVALLDCGAGGGVAESGTNGGNGGAGGGQAYGREARGGGERTDMSDDKARVVLVGTRRGGRARGGDKRRGRDTTEEGVGVYEACMYESEASGGGVVGDWGKLSVVMITRDTELQSGQVTHHNHMTALLHSGILLIRDKEQKRAARALSTVYCTNIQQQRLLLFTTSHE